MKTLILLTVVAIVCTVVHGSSYLVDAHNEEELIDARIQSLEKALIMKILQNEFAQIQIAVCNPQWQGKNYFLMKDQVTSFVNPRRTTRPSTKIYVPHEYTSGQYAGKELFVKSTGEEAGEQHAEDIMYKVLEGHLPQTYWINNSPCPRCALNLIERYEAMKIPEPRIMHFMHFYTLPTRYFPGMSEEEAKIKSRQLSLECMAKMAKHGFHFQTWDLGFFDDHYLTEQKCKDALKEALYKYGDEIKQDLNEGDAALKEVQRIALTTPEDQLCLDVPN